MSLVGTVHSLNVSQGGVPKLPVLEAEVGPGGMAGDRQADRQSHGGPRRALCLYSLERIEALAAEGHSMFPGSAGDNVTVEGVDWSQVVPGSRLRLGESVLIEVTDYTAPCWKNACWFSDGDFNRMNQRTHPGWSRVYAKVLEGGLLRAGDGVELLEERAAVRVQRTQPPTYRWRPPTS